ncbi:hypothetical protein L195_g011169 [Trifolium pratense]|uniref:Uncharacterized protein n=1 Tax=Trifolium pratense TaxID=57577 RepID=A0A2K3PGR5_TRIPR|nr:hypothetical protein L195_g003579 [Trifolium pratense]PNY14488.1 hypothetical protein L195_g011169 [Trifolium pratense]
MSEEEELLICNSDKEAFCLMEVNEIRIRAEKHIKAEKIVCEKGLGRCEVGIKRMRPSVEGCSARTRRPTKS